MGDVLFFERGWSHLHGINSPGQDISPSLAGPTTPPTFCSLNNPPNLDNVLSESLLHLLLWLIFRQMRINLINVRSTYAS